jgi:asparagine synthase (glutamine-hydrolysing)
MCGIVGMIGSNGAPADPDVVDRMAASIRHRGPDDHGRYLEGSIGLGFRRLAILDLLPTGHQPMCSEDGMLVLVFNGEIYNYVELREELEGLGHVFSSTGDTEVLLHAYMEWGAGCLERLNGMWAFLIYDKRRGLVFGSRDRFGKKPFYYYNSPPYFFCGSEVKAILASGRYGGGTNWKKACAFLLSHSFDQIPEDNKTFFAGIEQLPAGTAFELDSAGRFRQWTYWSLDCPFEKTDQIEDPARRWGEVFEDSIRLRLRSDVPVGIFLSGGLDSTSIICTLRHLQESGRAPAGRLFAFSYQSTEHDESRYISETVKQTGVELVSFQPDPLDLVGKLDRILWYQDEPVHSMAAIITFELSRLAAEHGVKVILNGGGPDEYLAGYPGLFPNYWHSVLQESGSSAAQSEIQSYCELHGGDPQSIFRRTWQNYFRVKLHHLSLYRKLAAARRRWQLAKHPWFTQEMLSHIDEEERGCIDYGLHSALRRCVKMAPLPHYLRIEDRNSMAHSIEARMPFLDYRLVMFAFALPPNWKARGARSKFILRQAMRGRIPESVRTRSDKMGFSVPTRTWFSGALLEPLLDMVNSKNFRERGIYRVAAVKRDIEAHRQGNVDISNRLLAVMQFEIWSQQHAASKLHQD